MSQITIRLIEGDELAEILTNLSSYAFTASPPFTNLEERRLFLRERERVLAFAGFEDDQPVASVAASRMTQNVRGKLYPMAGVWGVVTMPSVRRKGYSKSLISRLLEQSRSEGMVFSCLYPFRESFYERMGYTTFPHSQTAKFQSASLAPLLRKDWGGEVTLHRIGECFDTVWEYFQQRRTRVHGMALFDYPEKTRIIRSDSAWVAVAKVEGKTVGMMLYSLRGEEVTKFTLRATRFIYDTPQGLYLLLDWVARHIDQAVQVELWLPPFERPETWLADMKVQTEPTWIPPMGRVLDVGGLGGMETGSGALTVQVEDPICPWNNGAWRLESRRGRLQVAPSVDPAAARLTIHGLSALVFGTHDPGMFSWRGWGDPDPEAQEVLRRIFPPRHPYLHEMF